MSFEPSISFNSTLPDPEALDLREARKTLAFNFCFQATYPHVTQDSIRDCVLAYKRYNRMAEGVFAEVIRNRKSKKPS